MPKYIICTVGTSIAINLGLDREFVNGYRQWDMSSGEHENELSSKLNEYLRNNSDDEVMRRKLSAEINSLDKLGLAGDDRISLLVTDTYQGKMCAVAITRSLVQWYSLPENSIKTERIEGLQVNNQEQLVNVGLKNLVSKMIDILDKNQYGYEIIFNATGGYKGVVPFVTAIGMLFGKKIVYIFEGSKSLLTLPPLPLSFDSTLFNRARPALKYIEDESGTSKQAYLSRIIDFSPDEENLFMSFVESIGNDVTLSPLAFSLLTIEENRQKPKILTAIADYLNEIKGEDSDRLKEMIGNSSSVFWRNGHYHSFNGTDLLVFKQNRTALRIAGFLQDDVMYVTHAFDDHLRYERELYGAKKADYLGKTFVDWEN